MWINLSECPQQFWKGVTFVFQIYHYFLDSERLSDLLKVTQNISSQARLYPLVFGIPGDFSLTVLVGLSWSGACWLLVSLDSHGRRKDKCSPRIVYAPYPRGHPLLSTLTGQSVLWAVWAGPRQLPDVNAHSCQAPRGLWIPRAVGGPAGLIASPAPSREARGWDSLAWLRMKGGHAGGREQGSVAQVGRVSVL